jgi:beta-lactamase superfamily II metal-dependent hydrolase
MKVITFDVEHGSSHIIRTLNDQVFMIDAGSTENFSPALHILNNWGTKYVRWFTLTHHDADHLTDIDKIAENLQVMTLDQPLLDEAQLSQLYTEEFSTPLEVFLEFRKQFIFPALPISHPSYDWGGVQFAAFGNKFTDFENPNINDLSIATFAHYMGWTFMFPGDLEVPGWKKLLEIPEFCEWLKRVDVFITSHHGRESGFCEEVFSYCSPRIFIMSDKSRSETSCPDKYRPFAQGLSVMNSAGETKSRFVLTTAKDGAIYFYIDPEGRYSISTSA